jgi:hypothetical protein
MNKKQWINSKGLYYYNDIPVVTDKLPVGIYELGFDGFSKEFFLTHISDKFTLPEKVYGIEKGLNTRITQTFKSLDKNFGVLLKGLKGTGKTVLAKQVCNELGLPVILVNTSYGNMGNFINSINQDIIMLFDEFEKTYELSSYRDDDDEENGGKKNVNSLLTLMDGVFTSDYKRLFLLTTNKVYLPDAMISRPSRIRYIKEFGDLCYDDIIEILTDSVEDKELIPSLAEILSELEYITVDIVKSVAEEANICGIATKDFFEIFNVSREKEVIDLYEVFGDNKKEDELLVEGFGVPMENYYIGSSFNIRNEGIFGNVIEIDYRERILTIEVKGNRNNIPNKERTFRFKKSKFVHDSMVQYSF